MIAIEAKMELAGSAKTFGLLDAGGHSIRTARDYANQFMNDLIFKILCNNHILTHHGISSYKKEEMIEPNAN